MRCILIITLFVAQALFAKAFPTAEGYGANSVGGRGGKVMYVTTLTDSGTGSLRAAIQTSGARTIVFAVSGIIHAKKLYVVTNPYMTIAGQTSPSNGITIIGSGFYLATHDIIIQHLRIRNGDTTLAVACDQRDGIVAGENSYNIMIDHVSMSWSPDKEFTTWYNAKDISLQYSILSEGLDTSCQPKGPHSKALLIGDSTKHISVHHNYLVDNDDRNPMTKGCSQSDFINNIVYNWRTFGFSYAWDYCLTDTLIANNMYNYYKRGPSTRSWTISGFFTPNGGNPLPQNPYPTKIFIGGDAGDDSTLIKFNAKPDSFFTIWPFLKALPIDYPGNVNYVTDIAGNVSSILSKVGAIKPKRDSIDTRIINQYYNNTGTYINSQRDVGGYPKWPRIVWTSTQLNTFDKDRDGMPDSWELTHGLNPADSRDGKAIGCDGYTNLETYLNSL